MLLRLRRPAAHPSQREREEMREPRTQAGREFLLGWHEMSNVAVVEAILAIEDEMAMTPGFAVKLEGTYVVTQDGTLVEKPELEWLTRVSPGNTP